MNKGFIKLNRKFFETDYWEQERTFSLAEAWLDLIQSARFEANPQEKTLKNGREITVKQGEIHASLRYLSNRWGWSVGKVKRFIDKCIKKQQVEHRTEQGETVLRLCKYKYYNDNNKPKKNTDEHTDGHTDGTPTDTPTEQNKEYKELKKRKELEKRKQKFASTLEPFLETYGKDMLNEFYAYWTEPNKSNTKVRFELEKTWSLKRRLGTWAKNDKNFNKVSVVKETEEEKQLQKQDLLNNF